MVALVAQETARFTLLNFARLDDSMLETRIVAASSPHSPAPAGTGRGLQVSISNVRRDYGAVVAVDDVSLDIGAGEFVSLLGPSGSGKTTLLMILAGFEQPQAGSITIGGRDVTRVAPNKRDIAMVFQKYALFPHMSVAENIAFPLLMRNVDKNERASKVAKALEMVKLGGYGTRKPAELSGGQQQRVALARAIVFDPPVILMDEPLGALDKKLRQHMQIELKQLQRRLGATVIYVTHDQEEALTMSDRVAVLNHGKLMQYGPPRELYDLPADAFVADFLGEMNFIDGTVTAIDGGTCTVALAGGLVSAPAMAGLANGSAVRLAIRPEFIELLPAGAIAAGAATAINGGGSGRAGIAGTLAEVIFNGAIVVMVVELPDGAMVTASLNAHTAPDLAPGRTVTVTWPASAARLFPRGSA